MNKASNKVMRFTIKLHMVLVRSLLNIILSYNQASYGSAINSSALVAFVRGGIIQEDTFLRFELELVLLVWSKKGET